MTNVEVITLVLSSIAIVVAFLEFLHVGKIKGELESLRANVEIATSNAAASTEFTINARITATKEKVNDIHMNMISLKAKATPTDEEKKMIEAYNKSLDVAIENNINAYEVACSACIDKKIDVVRFKKNYKAEIKGLVEEPHLKKYFDGVSSKFKAILKVYEDWENLEK